MTKKFKTKIKGEGEEEEFDLEDKDYLFAVLLEQLNVNLNRMVQNG